MKNKMIKDIVYIAMFTAILVICSWITIPITVPITLQTLGIFCSLLFLGGKKGLVVIIVYLLLGVIGLPVFSGFGSGIGTLMGPTGGYLFGFMIIGILYLIQEYINKKNKNKCVALIIGLLLCYLFGTIWLCYYNKNLTVNGFFSNLLVCVLPFVVPDIVKLWLAFWINKRLSFLKEDKKRDNYLCE